MPEIIIEAGRASGLLGGTYGAIASYFGSSPRVMFQFVTSKP